MKVCTLSMPPKIYCGENAIASLAEVLAQYDTVKRVLLFTDAGVYQAGLCASALAILEEKKIEYTVFSDLKTEPGKDDVSALCARVKAVDADLAIAIGGGSVMDAAKLISCMYRQPFTIEAALEAPELLKKQIPCVMIPTTCGTGSEATCNAIVAVPEKQVKIGIVNTNMIPDYVILDPETIRTLPPRIIASTGIDALAHNVECFTSKKATPLSDLFSLTGTKLILENLVRAFSDANDMEAKANMMLAAFYGGAAITASGTTAVHALSYPLGGKFHIAHGVANAILLAPVMRFNRDACEERLALLEDAVNAAGYADSAACKSKRLVERLEKIVEAVGIPKDLDSFGVYASDIPFMVDAAADCTRLLNNNQKTLSKADIRALYEKITH